MLGRFHCKLYMWVLAVYVLEQILAVLCLIDDKGVIHKP